MCVGGVEKKISHAEEEEEEEDLVEDLEQSDAVMQGWFSPQLTLSVEFRRDRETEREGFFFVFIRHSFPGVGGSLLRLRGEREKTVHCHLSFLSFICFKSRMKICD